MKKSFFVLFALFILFAFNSSNAQYLTENFDSPWSGSPEAPTGWTQSRVVLIGNGIPDGISSTSGEKDWQRNVNTGVATWTLVPSTPGTVPNAAVSGTGVAWLQSRDFGGSSQNWGSRRLESPIINLSASTSPYVRFWMFFADGSTSVSLRIVGSADGGITWRVIQQVPSNFGQTTVNSATPWERVSIFIPSDFRTPNMKIGIEYTSIWGTNNLFIDDVTVEEFTPTTITSAMTGNWNVAGTWTGGVIPTSDNNVVIAAGHTVTSNVNIARMQDLTVNGTLNYSSATSTLLNCIQGNLNVNAGGVYNSYFSTTGKRTYLGGNMNNAGTIDFAINATSTSEATLIFMGYGIANFTNTGTINHGKMNGVWHFKDGQVQYMNPVTITTRAVFGLGNVDPNSNLTLGNSAVTASMIIEKQKGNLLSAPNFGAGVTRSVQYNDGSGVSGTMANQFAPCNRINTIPGEEVEILALTMARTVTGTLTINTHGNVQLNYPLTVGTATSGGLTLTRGIVLTTSTNILRASSFFTPGSGTDPSTVTPPVTHGSYISGPMRIDFPTSTASRTFALGVGSAYNDSIPNSNVRKAVLLATTTAWTASTSLTGSITAKPTGSMVMGDSSSIPTGVRGYNIDLNGGPDLPTNSTINLGFRNYNFGDGNGSDSILGSQNNIRLIQSTALTGPWTSRTNASGSGTIVANTNYTRTSPTAAPGPIAPLGTNGGFFAWGTSALANDIAINFISPTGTSFYVTPNIPMTGSVINNGITTTTSGINVTRRIIGTGYVDTKTVPSGLTPTSIANITFADFTGWTAGVTYTIKDSLYYIGDVIPTNDTLSATFTPQAPKTTLVIYGTDTRSRDSLMSHFNDLIGPSYTNFVDFSVGMPNISLSNWRSVIACFASTLNWSTAFRDSMKAFLDNANDAVNKKSLLIFGNDLGYNNDPRRNASAPAADTVFYRQYLRAQYWSDDWVDNFVLSDSTTKGLGAFSTITNQRVNDPFPDAVAPAMWNQGSGTITSALIPITESGDGDTATAISYSGTFYNVFYGTNVYANYLGTGFADAPSGQLLEVVDSWIQSQGGSLPVELASFSASSNRNSVELKWVTSSEINNSGFDIERKSIDQNVWTKIGNVQGSGNSSVAKNYIFNDNNLQTGKYNYRLKQIDYNGNFEYFNLSSEVNVGIPNTFDLSQNYPNPFNPMTKINFDLASDSKVTLKVFDMLGREVYTVLNNELKTAGYYTTQLNFGSLASGTYFYRIIAIGLNGQEFITTKKMQLVK